MANRDPEKNFEEFWKTFNDRYPFFELHKVDWKAQYDKYRPLVTKSTTDEELYDILCKLVAPLDDGHVELTVKLAGDREERFFTPEKTPRFYREFNDKQIKKLFKTTGKTLINAGFGKVEKTKAWMLRYARSRSIGYIRILELEDIKKRKLVAALDKISGDFESLDGFIIDIRDCPGGDDSTALTIINRFTDKKRVAFHRKTRKGPGEDDYGPLKTWHMEPEGDLQFTKPVIVLTCDAVFSGGEAFALAIRELPHVTILGDHTNGIFSYTLDKELPNGWEYCLSYQVYMSPDMICFEGKGVPADIELLNTKADIEQGTDPLIIRALELIRDGAGSAMV